MYLGNEFVASEVPDKGSRWDLLQDKVFHALETIEPRAPGTTESAVKYLQDYFGLSADHNDSAGDGVHVTWFDYDREIGIMVTIEPFTCAVPEDAIRYVRRP